MMSSTSSSSSSSIVIVVLVAAALINAAAMLGSVAAAAPSASAFVRRRGSQFELHGSPFLFNGFNAYWMMHLASSDPAQRHKVSEVFREASAAGLTVCRTWAFNDGGADAPALQISPGTYDQRVFEGLDFVVSEASRYGLRLILAFVNNYKDFGGRPQYAQWARDAGARDATSDDAFYTHPLIRRYYKDHVRTVITRVNTITRVAYRDDPTIMAWELINEPRCESDYSGRTVNGWVAEMAAYVKSLDGKHLVEIGMEGFYGETMPERKQQVNPGYEVGTDFIRSNLIGEVDFATIHAYPDIWESGKSDGEQAGFMERWLWAHWDDAAKILRKPLVVAEFGKSSKDPGFSLAARDAYMGTVYRDVYRYARMGGNVMGGSLVWQLMAEGMDAYHDGYEIVLSQSPSTAGIMSRQSHAMAALARLQQRTTSAANSTAASASASAAASSVHHQHHI
ncbi:mannan endo-1,4-beta-mannosidase 1-like [Andrographis paniculata]|uniref:mannan endo-1,4-beta-mannosidase 1-like n=1 Tax=Andrographis paniculata TaxID=175694 RepID=UPI0021E7B0D6|nr:mannan endo-1,4-beta-mannosidase 1-like [Andrographis paniculata]